MFLCDGGNLAENLITLKTGPLAVLIIIVTEKLYKGLVYGDGWQNYQWHGVAGEIRGELVEITRIRSIRGKT